MTRAPSSAAVLFLASAALPFAFAQDPGIHPPPYRGVNTLMDGVFVTPVPGAPFSAVVKLETTQTLADGTTEARKSISNIARDSQGRIYNERRQLVPASFPETPALLSSHLFDPQTRVSTLLNPYTRLARQQIIPERPARPELAAQPAGSFNSPSFKQEDLGSETMGNLAVHGIRQTRTIPAPATSTGKDIVVVDEYWYSDELHMNMFTKRSDPRTGIQQVTITEVKRDEPDAALFQVPSGYKVVDENPPN